MTKKYRSEVLQSVQEAAADLRSIGAIDKEAMRRFDKACLTDIDVRALKGVKGRPIANGGASAQAPRHPQEGKPGARLFMGQAAGVSRRRRGGRLCRGEESFGRPTGGPSDAAQRLLAVVRDRPVTRKKKPAAANTSRFDPYKSFKFRVMFRSVASGGMQVARTLKAAIDAAFTRRMR